MNGGISATLIDCHSVCTATAYAYRHEGRAMASDPEIWCVTGSMELEYLAPVPIDQPVDLRARIVGAEGRKARLECILASNGRECVRGRVLAIRVSAAWREPAEGHHRAG
jgi:acyl-CoA thioesterase FadM